MNGIMKYINRISRCNGVVYANRLRGYGITQCQHPYILLICREPGIPQEKISRELCVNKSSVTRQITLMEEKGLIMRKQGPDRPAGMEGISHPEDAGAAAARAAGDEGVERISAGRVQRGRTGEVGCRSGKADAAGTNCGTRKSEGEIGRGDR